MKVRFNGTSLEIKFEGLDWSDFIPEDRRAYTTEQYDELMGIWNTYHKTGIIASKYEQGVDSFITVPNYQKTCPKST